MAGCICEGNWRLIVKEYESKIGQIYNGRNGETLRFYGLVHGDDDYYYGLRDVRSGKCHLVSCCMALETVYEPILVEAN